MNTCAFRNPLYNSVLPVSYRGWCGGFVQSRCRTPTSIPVTASSRQQLVLPNSLLCAVHCSVYKRVNEVQSLFTCLVLFHAV